MLTPARRSLPRAAIILSAVLALVAAVGTPAYAKHRRSRPVPGMVVCCTPPPIHLPGANHLMPLGDSITVGACSTSGDGYRDRLDAQLRAADYPPVWVGTQVSASGMRHEGHGGWTIDQLAAGVQGGWLASPPEWVLLDAGTNDGGQNRTAAQMLASMSTLLDRILAAGVGVKVIVAQITITTYNTAAQQQAEQDYDNGLPALATSKGWRVRTVDMRGVELAPASTCTPGGVYPDDAGYQQMADRWYAAVQHWRGVL